MRCLARLIRCAIVASGTRNAAAISAVVRPPTARSVSASCDGAESDGWQHRNSSVSVSSSAGGWCPARRLQRGDGLLPAPPRALAAPLVDQPPLGDGQQPRARVVRHALVRPLQRRGEQRLLHRVLARVELPVPAYQHAEDLRRELAQQVLDPAVRRHTSGGASPTWRTSIGSWMNATTREAISSARASFSTSTIQ